MGQKVAHGMANSVDPDQTAPRSDCSSRSSLIWVYTVCLDLSVRKLRNITVLHTLPLANLLQLRSPGKKMKNKTGITV